MRVALAAVAVAAVAFLFRFNTLGGALGGFDNDHFIYLIRTDALLAGEQPLRDFVDAELRGAWPALTYEVSAWAQRLGGRTLLPEAYLTVGLIALAHALVFVLAYDVSRRWWVALLAAVVAIATFPKLYNYNKVLALVLGAWSLRATVLNPSALHLAIAALTTAIAVLFRHDLGIYPAAAIVIAIVVREAGHWNAVMRRVGIYGGLLAILLLPSAIWVQTYEGLAQYVRDASASVAVEQARTNLRVLEHETSEIVAYVAFWATVVAALVTIAPRLLRAGPHRSQWAIGAGLLVMTALANQSFLRANLAERFGDAAPAMVLLAAWIAGTAPGWTSPVARRLAAAGPVAVLVCALGASVVFSDVRRELDTAGLSDSVRETLRRYRTVSEELSAAPPASWAGVDAPGTLVAARYVAECSRPEDRILALGPVHEVLVYGRRRFAAGQAMFKLSLYTSEAQQRRALARLEHQAVPLVIADTDEFEEFQELYPLVAAYLAGRYRDAGEILVNEEPRFRVFVASSRLPAGTHPALGLPCFA